MGLWSKIKSAVSRVAVAFSLIPSYLAGIRWWIDDKWHNLVEQGYKFNSVVYSCIRVLASGAAEAKLRFYEATGGEENPLPGHEFQTLFNRPNSIQTQYDFTELTVTYLSIVGKAFWWKERANDDSIIALWPLRPDRVRPIYGRGLPPLAGWYYDLDGETFQLPAADILYFNYPDPSGPSGGIIEGIGPLQVLARDVDIDNQSTRFCYALLRNYAMPGLVIKTKAKLNEQQAEELKKKFARKYGNLHVGEPAIIDADTEVDQLSFNMRELQFPELRDNLEARLCAAFGVPPILVGLKVGLDRSTFSNMREAREFFTETTLSVIWARMTEQINSDPDFGEAGVYARFDTSNVRALQAQHNEQAKRYADAFFRGAITRNEYRTKGLRMPARPDGDVYLLPRGMGESAMGTGETIAGKQ